MRCAPTETNVLPVLLLAAGLFAGAVPSCLAQGQSHPAQGQSASFPQEDAAAPFTKTFRLENDSFVRGGAFVQGGAGYFAVGLHFPGLQLPSRGASWEKRAFLLRLGGGLEYCVETSGGGGLLVGLEAGSLFPAGESVDTNGNFTRGLDASMQGPFVRLTFGGGA